MSGNDRKNGTQSNDQHAARVHDASVTELTDRTIYPPHAKRLEYRSGHDGKTDWAIYTPGDAQWNTVGYMHGSFSLGDEIVTRQWRSTNLAGK